MTLTAVKDQKTSAVEMDEDMRQYVIEYLKQMVEELEDPTRTFLDTRFVHKPVDEPGFILTIKLNNAYENDSKQPSICSQTDRDAIADMIIQQAKRIRRAHCIPLLVEGSHNRPTKFVGSTPTHDGNEEFSFRVVYERPPGTPIKVQTPEE